MRRIDSCGLVTRDAVAKIGEIGSVGTLFALDECDVDIKVPDETERRYATIEVTLGPVDDSRVALRTGNFPVYETYPGSCDLPAAAEPVAAAWCPAPAQTRPTVRADRADLRRELRLPRRLARAIAPRVESLQLPIRDAVATYPAALAERDPCQVLSVVGAEVDHWDINRSRPYECDFGVWRNGYDDVVPMQVTLEPQLFDMATETRQRRDRDGVELFVDETYCSAAAFLGVERSRGPPRRVCGRRSAERLAASRRYRRSK